MGSMKSYLLGRINEFLGKALFVGAKRRRGQETRRIKGGTREG